MVQKFADHISDEVLKPRICRELLCQQTCIQNWAKDLKRFISQRGTQKAINA
jgi:hypothetical protein